MVRPFIIAGLLLLLSQPIFAATRKLACYLDGGLLTREIIVSKGYVEAPLPAGMIPGTLRVKSGNGAVIIRVQSVPVKVTAKTDRALALLDERRDLLGDRLKSLQTREEIFTAAARSQSAKAPRKSKANPEPVAAIRQGTDLALARLEEVYRLRRGAEKELKVVALKRADLLRRANVGGTLARIWLRGGEGKSGSVTVEYVVGDAAWKPAYDLRLDGTDKAILTLRALLPEIESGTSVAVVATTLSSPGTSALLLPVADDYAIVAAYTLPVIALATVSPISPLSLIITNSSLSPLPSGDVSCFWKEEYRGTAHLPVVIPGERKELHCGPAAATPAAPVY